MTRIINDCLTGFNRVGEVFCTYAGGAFVQSALLVLLLFAIDLLLCKRVRAIVRYCVWLLVLVKLVLPPTLALPTGIGYWLGDRLPARSGVSERPANAGGFEGAAPHRLERSEPSGGVSPVLPAPSAGEADAPVKPAPLRVTPVTWQGLVLLFWLAGVLSFVALLAQRVRFVKGLIAASAPAGGELLDLLEQCRRQIGVRRQVGLKMSDGVPSPAVCGLLRPIVLIPSSLVKKLPPEGLKAALIHELAHIKRGDLWINSLQTLLQVVYFYNPFVWFANAMIRRTCEQAVDETVLVTLGGQARDYSNTLIDIGEMAFWKADFGLRLIGVAESRRALQGRIKHMLTRPVPKSARLGALGTVAILVVAAVLLPMARAEKSSHEPSAPAPASAAPATEKTPVASESDTIVDPKTGVKFTVAARITGENDVIAENHRLRPSHNDRFLLYKGQVVPLDGSKPFKLEALHDREEAAWSPDGKLIAYRDNKAIWLLPVSPETGQPTGPARKLLDGPIDWPYCEILWSRDSDCITLSGCYAIFGDYRHITVSVQDGQLIPSPDYTRFGLPSPDQKNIAYFRPHSGVWTAPVGGGASRLVLGEVDYTRPQSVTVPLWWSPDGQWLLCAFGMLGANHSQLRFARLADHRETVLKFPEGFWPYAMGLAPDSKKLQICKPSYEWRDGFKVAPIRGGAPVELAFSGRIASVLPGFPPTGPFSPDGQRWLFIEKDAVVPYVAASAAADPVELRLAGEVKRTGPLARTLWHQRWLVSPDCKKLAYWDESDAARRPLLCDLFVVPISLEEAQSAGPAIRVLKERPAPGLVPMAWSPDSSRLTIGGPEDFGLWVIPTDGSPAKQLTTQTGEVVDPKWSPDGKLIAYTEFLEEGEGFSVIPVEGGVPKRVWTKSTKPVDRSWPYYAWFPDSKEIGLVFDDAIVAISVADGSVRPFLKLADMGFTRLRWFQWSPDGRTLGLCGRKDDGDFRVALFHASDKRIEMVPDPDLGEHTRPGWTGDSQALFYKTGRYDKVRPAGLIYEVDIEEAWIQAKNSVAGESSPASASPIATSEAPPLVDGEFRDDFEDGDTKYWTFKYDNSHVDHVCEVQNGQLVLENARAVMGTPEWTNYVVAVKMSIKEPGNANGARALGIRFRSGEYGEYCLSVQEGPVPKKSLWFGIRYPVANERERTSMLTEPNFDFVLDRWYTIQVEVKGPHIVVRVDGRPMIDLKDENCPQGPVTLSADMGTRGHFDDFSVRLLP